MVRVGFASYCSSRPVIHGTLNAHYVLPSSISSGVEIRAGAEERMNGCLRIDFEEWMALV